MRWGGEGGGNIEMILATVDLLQDSQRLFKARLGADQVTLIADHTG